ncbi:MAG: c-type cytochrome [Pseudomonadota bacterium]
MRPTLHRAISWFALPVAMAAGGFSTQAAADDSPALLQKECAACHNLSGPSSPSLQALWARKGPDLFFAGNKYRRDWLEQWLQKPQRIRPAGMFYAANIKPGDKSDVVDESLLQPHLALDKKAAAAAADALMKLKPHDDLIAREKIEAGSISRTMGEMVFDKFAGCLACHLIEPDYGGVSGPELYTAAKRLQPEFIASFIRNPQAWDAKTWMPNKHVSDANIQKLVRYLDVLAKESADAK